MGEEEIDSRSSTSHVNLTVLCEDLDTGQEHQRITNSPGPDDKNFSIFFHGVEKYYI